jgi:hypothetical protein
MMTGMSDFWDKLWSMEFGIALLGALVGGAFTILGSAWQTWSANKAAALAQAKANAQRGFDALTQLKAHLEIQTFQGLGTKESRAAWNREREMLVTTANSAIMLLPDEHKDTRLYVEMLLRRIKTWHGMTPWSDYKVETSLLLAEALKFLGLFVRGSDAPERRDMGDAIKQEVEKHRREEARRELDSLLAEEEADGLDQADSRRVHELLDFLDLPYPLESSTDDTPGTS